jgi:hypothetical protein
MLAAEDGTPPKPMRSAVIRVFDGNRTWLAHVLSGGLQDRTLTLINGRAGERDRTGARTRGAPQRDPSRRDGHTDAFSADHEYWTGGTLCCLLADARERQRSGEVTATED